MTDLQERVAGVYDWVASYIETNGWVQGRAFGDRRKVCIAGAFVMADSIFGASLVELARTLLRCEIGQIGRWNDTPGREVWEVLETLRTMAKRARAGDLAVAA